MVMDTINNQNGTATPNPRGKAKEILADAASIAGYKDMGKNTQVSFSGHCALYGTIVEHLAKDAGNIIVAEGKTVLKRSAYSAFLRHAVASAVEYTGPLTIGTLRGQAGITSVFNNVVKDMFELAMSLGTMANMSEDQVKQIAFAKARSSVTAHPQLSGIELPDELLEQLWAGNEVDVEVDDDDDDDEPVAAAPTPALA